MDEHFATNVNKILGRQKIKVVDVDNSAYLTKRGSLSVNYLAS